MIARRMFLFSGILSFGLLSTASSRAQSAGAWLISSAEASLPPSIASETDRAIGRGPAIRQVSPDGAVSAGAPFELRVEFAGRGGEKIAPTTVRILLLRGGNIDLAQRLKAYITPTGIVMPNAMVPAGTYVLQVVVADADGHQSTANIEIDAR
jgi:hypothetical protein